MRFICITREHFWKVVWVHTKSKWSSVYHCTSFGCSILSLHLKNHHDSHFPSANVGDVEVGIYLESGGNMISAELWVKPKNHLRIDESNIFAFGFCVPEAKWRVLPVWDEKTYPTQARCVGNVAVASSVSTPLLFSICLQFGWPGDGKSFGSLWNGLFFDGSCFHTRMPWNARFLAKHTSSGTRGISIDKSVFQKSPLTKTLSGRKASLRVYVPQLHFIRGYQFFRNQNHAIVYGYRNTVDRFAHGHIKTESYTLKPPDTATDAHRHTPEG